MERHLSEAILTEILARLPLRSISRFKLVCKTWKSTIESAYFRRLFVSLHKNSSSCWSLVLGRAREVINLHRCKTWDLPESLACYIEKSDTGKYKYWDSSNGLVFMNRSYDGTCYVGNPVLQEWVKIPCPPYKFVSLPFGLVTRVDEDGVVLGFKVVRMIAAHKAYREKSLTCLCLCVYSSETGIWTRKRLDCLHYFTTLSRPMGLNGTLYISSSGFDGNPAAPGAIVAHDFYGESNLCKVIPLPDHDLNHNRDFKRALTTCTGSVMYLKTLPDNLLKVWMLLNDSEWQLVWETRLPFDGDIRYYAPLAMNPFDRNLVYLWSQRNRYLVSCNLQTQNYKIESKRYFDDDDDDHLQHCFVNQSTCEKVMDELFKAYSIRDYGIPVCVSQLVFPRWMESMPLPPLLEMIDTTSLLSYVASLPEDEEEEEEEDDEE